MTIVKTYNTEEEWLEARRGKITGTVSSELTPKVRGEGYRAGFYKILAERISIPEDGENRMDRGLRLEGEAIDRFNKETGKKAKHTQYTLCWRDDDPDIAYSPDAMIGKTQDVEVKCRNSAVHIEVFLTQQYPKEYTSQVIQAFVVNDTLKTRYLVFYDPSCPKDFFYFTITRASLKKEIAEYLKMEREALVKMKEIEDKLTF